MPRRPLGSGRLRRAPFLAPLLVVALAADIASTQDQPGRGRRDAPVFALKAGTVHPISGPAITDGIVLFRGSRILAVGPASEVEVPESATVLAYPEAHVYPGLVDALSRAFAGTAGNDGSSNAGSELAEALDLFDKESQGLLEYGITTVYVSNRAATTWRGQGALVRPQTEGFAAFPEHATVGVHMRLTTGPAALHPLERIKKLKAYGREFGQLEAYEKGFEQHLEKAEEYQKKFEEFLDWHREHAGEDDGASQAEEEEVEGKGEGKGEQKPAEPDAEAKAKAGEKPQGAGKPAEKKPDEDKAPERPKFPAEPKRDPAKDALIEVRDGELALFVEARRPDEVERALEIAREHELRRLVLEYATGAAPAIDSIAAAGVGVVIDSALPPALSHLLPDGSTYVGESDAWTSLAARLAAQDVPLAIGSGSLRRARHLPSLVAEAIGAGVPHDVALRAVTLTPAEILGIADRVGSLEPRKLADLVVTSAPLEATDARVLRVISAGNTVHEDRR